jgi:hypothetical protein
MKLSGMKKLSLFFAGFLTATCACVVLWRLNVLPNSLLDELTERDKANVEVLGNLPSPGGEYVVTTNKASNRTGWCEVRLNVHKKNEPFDWEYEFVCVAGCDTQLEQRWEDDRHLSITYSSRDIAKAIKTYQQFWSKDKAVRISYALKQ